MEFLLGSSWILPSSEEKENNGTYPDGSRDIYGIQLRHGENSKDMEESLLKIIEDDERTESTLVPDEEMHALIDDSGPEEKNGEPIEEVGKESAVPDVEMNVLNEDVGPADKNETAIEGSESSLSTV